MVRFDPLHVALFQVKFADRIDVVELLGSPEIVPQLGALRFAVLFAPGAFVNHRIGLGAGDPICFSVGGEVDGALVGEALGVELFSALDVDIRWRNDQLSVEVEPG